MTETVSSLDRAKRDLVIANRILAMEGITDAAGHVSIRHPDDPERYLLSRSLSPGLVEFEDIIEYRLDSTPVADQRPAYLERFIHGAVFEARPDVQAVVHAHTEATLPFGLTTTPLRAVIHVASDIGSRVPVWDIADTFGDHTDLHVTNVMQGRDMAKALGSGNAVLMRGHGFTAAGTTLLGTLRLAVFLPLNARVLLEALRLGEVKGLSEGEITARRALDPTSPGLRRSWEFWARKAGVGHLL